MGTKFGLLIDQNLPWNETAGLWKLYEELGLDSLWNCDHLVQASRPDGPWMEGWTQLAALATQTSRVPIGCLVTCNTFRNPALVAKMAITVDHVSNGRLWVGLGAGYFKQEHDMFGIELPEPKELVARFREAVQVVDAMLRNETVSFEGTYYRVRNGNTRPGPVQRPRPPMVLGAHGPVMLKIVARYADAWNSFGTPAQIKERSAVLSEKCAEIGRDPKSITRSVYWWASKSALDPWSSVDAFDELVGMYREAGVDEFIIDHPRRSQIPMLERIMAEAVPKYRA